MTIAITIAGGATNKMVATNKKKSAKEAAIKTSIGKLAKS